jgi:hypothetical protein
VLCRAVNGGGKGSNNHESTSCNWLVACLHGNPASQQQGWLMPPLNKQMLVLQALTQRISRTVVAASTACTAGSSRTRRPRSSGSVRALRQMGGLQQVCAGLCHSDRT